MAKSDNAPGQTGGGLGQISDAKSGKGRRIDSDHLVSPVAFSRFSRELNRTRKKQDKKMGSRVMR